MEHIAIDLGGRESQICVRSEDGKIIEERPCATSSLKGYLRRRAPGRVIVETCSEAFGVADAARAMGHEVRVVPATLVRSLGVGHRGIKTDARDAQVLSEVSCRVDLPSVHIPSKQARERKTLCNMRDTLIESRTRLVNVVRGWLRSEGLQLRSGSIETFPARVRRRYSETRATELPRYVARELEAIETLTEKIHEADVELVELAEKDPLCIRLMTAPGVGPITAVRFTATLDDIDRFSHAHAVQSYLGLTPGENSSSTRKRRTGITKAGSAPLRRVLTQACWTARRYCKQDPLVLWSSRIEQRRGKHIAITALMRKLVGILYAMWRDGTVYQSERSAMTA